MQFIKKLDTIQFVILVISIICFFTLCFKAFASEYYLYPQSSYESSGVILDWKLWKAGDFTQNATSGISYANALVFCSDTFGEGWRLPYLDEVYNKFTSGGSYESYFYKNEYSRNFYQLLNDDNDWRVSTTTAPYFSLNYSNGAFAFSYTASLNAGVGRIVGACVKESGGGGVIASSNDFVTMGDMGSTTSIVNGFTYGEIMLITIGIIICFIGIYISLKITLK